MTLLITALYWLKPPVYPHVICRSRAEGVAWCAGQLAITEAHVA